MLKPLLLTVTTLLIANIALADTTATAPHKTYTLVKLQRVVTNSPSCRPIFDSLKSLSSNHIHLSFKPTGEKGNFVVTDLKGVMQNSTFKILKEHVSAQSINRVGMGSFELNKQKIDYVIQVGVDLSKSTKDYLYPVILSGDTHLCYYSALLKPSEETTTAFKKNIQAGTVNNGNDLAR
ncbi:MAG: hypothetical protein Q8L78_06700 [Coxiellaceae bacterium]|nr:hypothetical protein [Coxiellaceae bacterium]